MMRLVWLVFLLSIVAETSSQHLYTRQYTLEEGLRSMEVYWVSIDESNKVWIHNDVGLFGYYDGIKFTYINKDSLQHTGFQSRLLHKKGYTYLSSDAGRLHIFKNDESYFNNIDRGRLKGPLLHKGRVCMVDDPNQTIYYYDEKLNTTDSLKIDIGPLKKIDEINKYVGFGHNYCHNGPIGYLFKNPQDASIIYNKNTREFLNTHRRYALSLYSEFYISFENDRSKVEVETPMDDQSIYFDKLFSFPATYEFAKFIENRSKAYLLLRENNDSKSNYGLYDITTEAVKRIGSVNYPQIDFQARLDSNNMFWGASHQGLYKVNPYLLEFSSDEDNMINSLHSIVEDSKGDIWFAGYKTGMAVYDNNKIIKAPTESFINSNYLPGGTQINEKAHFITSSTQPIVIASRSGIKRKKLIYTNATVDKNPTGYMIKEIDNTIYLGLRDKGLGIVEKMDESEWYVRTISKEHGLNLDNVLTIEKDLNGRIWAGRSSQGVAVYDPKIDSAYTWRIDPENPASFGSISSVIDSRGNLWMGTNKGLYFVKEPHQVVFGGDLFTKARHIPFPDNNRSMVTAVIESNGYIVAGNSSAINFVVQDSFYHSQNDPLIYTLKYGEDIGGDGTEQNCMINDSKGYLWIGSHTGATRMDLKNYPFENSPIEIEIKDVITGQNSIPYYGQTIRIPKDNRNFSLKIHPSVNYSLQNNIYYNYHLVNKSKDTFIADYNINNPFISMSYIPQGDYIFHVEAYKNGRKSDEIDVEICVPRTLSENPFFWAGLIGITLIGLASYIIIRGRQKRKLLEKDLALSKLKNDKTNLQVQAIISSFNPHFINNSLHWAQSRYKKDQSLVTLIGRLSKNIQYIFDKTRIGKAFHSLKEELELVKNYVTIQKIRFDDGFDLHLPDDAVLRKYASFPVLLMQIQIHVENAIEHGLRNRIDSSEVKISISEDADNLIIKITDDGGGRNKAEQLNSKGTQKGTNMLDQLHSIFNKNNSNKIITIYEDDIFTNPTTNDNYGTRVIISIPKQYNYELEKT